MFGRYLCIESVVQFTVAFNVDQCELCRVGGEGWMLGECTTKREDL